MIWAHFDATGHRFASTQNATEHRNRKEIIPVRTVLWSVPMPVQNLIIKVQKRNRVRGIHRRFSGGHGDWLPQFRRRGDPEIHRREHNQDSAQRITGIVSSRMAVMFAARQNYFIISSSVGSMASAQIW
jgi:hypothetical protein